MFLKILVFLSLALTFGGVSPARAGSGRFVLGAGSTFEGPQGTVKSAPALSTAWEEPRAFGAVGLAAEWVADTRPHGRVDIAQFGLFARREFGNASLRPFAAGGLGVAMLRWDFDWAAFAERKFGPAGWLSLGVARRLSAAVDVRLEGRYVSIASSLPRVDGLSGNMEDYFSAGAAVAFGR